MVKLYKKKPYKNWYAYWYDPEAKKNVAPRSTGTTNKTDAYRVGKKFYEDWLFHKNKFKLISKNHKISELREKFLTYKVNETADISKRTIMYYRTSIELLIEAVGDVYVKDLTANHYLEYIKYLTEEKKHATNTKNHYTRQVKAFLNWAVKFKFIETNHFGKVPYRKPIYKILTDEEVEQIILLSGEYKLKHLMSFLVLTGLRITEAITLKWSNVDFKSRELSLFVKMGKYRKIGMTTAIYNLLQSIPRKNERVFYPIWGKDTYKFFKVVKRRLGLEIANHDLRRYRLTQMMRNNVPVTAISDWAGHEKAETTLDLYIYFQNKETLRVVELADKVLPPSLQTDIKTDIKPTPKWLYV